MRVLSFLLLLVFAFSSPVLADVNVGDTLSSSLELQDHTGTVQSFDALKGKKGAVLIFVRSADWCPYCQVQLLDLRDTGPSIEALGYNVVAISYDAPEVLAKFKAKYKFPYAMLSDEGSATIKAFGILNEKFAPDHFAYGVPHPTVYVVNTDGFVQAVLAEDGYKKRPQGEVIVEAIKSSR